MASGSQRSRASSRASAPRLSRQPSKADSLAAASEADGQGMSTSRMEFRAQGTAFLEDCEAVFKQLLESEDRRRLALGDKYEVMKLDDKMLAEAAEDVRQARLYQQLRMVEETRKVELEERLKIFSAEERVLQEERHRLSVAADRLRNRARAKFCKEAEAAKWVEQQKFEGDKRFIIDSEREKLVRRRREYEVQLQTSQPQRTVSTSRASPGRSSFGGEVVPPHVSNERNVILVMTVTVGKDREEVLTVREYDDYYEVARKFAETHQLPSAIIEPLVREIAKNIESKGGHVSRQGSYSPTYSMAGGRVTDPVFSRNTSMARRR